MWSISALQGYPLKYYNKLLGCTNTPTKATSAKIPMQKKSGVNPNMVMIYPPSNTDKALLTFVITLQSAYSSIRRFASTCSERSASKDGVPIASQRPSAIWRQMSITTPEVKGKINHTIARMAYPPSNKYSRSFTLLPYNFIHVIKTVVESKKAAQAVLTTVISELIFSVTKSA